MLYTILSTFRILVTRLTFIFTDLANTIYAGATSACLLWLPRSGFTFESCNKSRMTRPFSVVRFAKSIFRRSCWRKEKAIRRPLENWLRKWYTICTVQCNLHFHVAARRRIADVFVFGRLKWKTRTDWVFERDAERRERIGERSAVR